MCRTELFTHRTRHLSSSRFQSLADDDDEQEPQQQWISTEEPDNSDDEYSTEEEYGSDGNTIKKSSKKAKLVHHEESDDDDEELPNEEHDEEMHEEEEEEEEYSDDDAMLDYSYKKEVSDDDGFEEYVNLMLGDATLDDELESEIVRLYFENPIENSVVHLAKRFDLLKEQVEAVIYFRAKEDMNLTLDELKEKIRMKKEEIQKMLSEFPPLQEKKSDDPKEQQEAQMEMEVEKVQENDNENDLDQLLETDREEAFRNPQFFFLNDELEGYPPLTRRLGKFRQTDIMYPQEAIAMQEYSKQKKFEVQKSFAKRFDTKSRLKIAVKDISKPKNPMYIRENGMFRLGTAEEIIPRSWVRRLPFFKGIESN